MPFWSRAIIALCLAVSAHVAAAAEFPDRPVRIVVPYAAGGFTDILARLIANPLADRLGQPVVIENRAGASTIVGAEAVARASADGYTLLMATTSTLSTNPLLFRKLSYKMADFAPVALTGRTSLVLVANPSVPANDAAGLVAYARQNPGKLNLAMLGPGSSTHLVDEMFRVQAKVDIPDVPYRGSGPAAADVIAGHVQMTFEAVSTAIPRIHGGRVKGLGITADARSPLLPDVPTFKEAGLPGMVAYSWYGLLAPAATPQPIVDKLNALVNEVLQLPEVHKQLAANDAVAPTLSPKQFGDLIVENTSMWEQVIKPLNLRLD